MPEANAANQQLGIAANPIASGCFKSDAEWLIHALTRYEAVEPASILHSFKDGAPGDVESAEVLGAGDGVFEGRRLCRELPDVEEHAPPIDYDGLGGPFS